MIKYTFFLSFVVLSTNLFFGCNQAPSSEKNTQLKPQSFPPQDSVDISKLPSTLQGLKKMQLIQGGKFTMGSPDGKVGEKPPHSIYLHSFYMDETPITYTDFQKYVDDGGTKGRYWKYDSYNKPEQPVTGINWYHAVNYCNWRSQKEGLQPTYFLTDTIDIWGYPLWKRDTTANGYRLPTEAEFEYAAQGGLENKPFPWGDDFKNEYANYDIEVGIRQDGWWRLAPVQSQYKNAYGLYGMSGNIWQMCDDWYEEKYYEKNQNYNPTGPETGRSKVMRGGGWGVIDSTFLRVFTRSYTAPSNYNYSIGFRCVRPVRSSIIDSISNNYKKLNNFDFYTYTTSHYENPHQTDVYGKEFTQRLGQFLHDYYPDCLYFITAIDQQEILTPYQMAKLIVTECQKHKIHPLFLTGIMVSESGFATCSFPRWWNNPMAYHWQNLNMKKGLPSYTADRYHNRKYKDLRVAIRNFARIRRSLYINAAKKNLDGFHLIYVGYRADEWMYTISRIYKDVLGVRFEPNFPSEGAGKYIFTDWEKLAAN